MKKLTIIELTFAEVREQVAMFGLAGIEPDKPLLTREAVAKALLEKTLWAVDLDNHAAVVELFIEMDMGAVIAEKEKCDVVVLLLTDSQGNSSYDILWTINEVPSDQRKNFQRYVTDPMKDLEILTQN